MKQGFKVFYGDDPLSLEDELNRWACVNTNVKIRRTQLSVITNHAGYTKLYALVNWEAK